MDEREILDALGADKAPRPAAPPPDPARPRQPSGTRLPAGILLVSLVLLVSVSVLSYRLFVPVDDSAVDALFGGPGLFVGGE